MSTEFENFKQILAIEDADKERLNSLKLSTFQALRSIPETWIFKLLDKSDSEKFHEYLENITGIIVDNIKNINDLPALEFISNNISEILFENNRIEKKLERDYNDQENNVLTFEDFKKELEYSGSVFGAIYSQFEKEKKENIEVLKLKLEILNKSCLAFKKIKDNFDEYFHVYISQGVDNVNKELEGFRRLRNLADNAKTEDIYDKAVKKYRKYEWINRSVFLILLGLVILISLIFWDSDYLNNIINEPTYAKSAIFWSVKITSLVAGVTLITYFLKQSSHYQRLADQNYQTQLELQAYPSFMESINTEDASSVRKELALKYFGREIDGAAHKDMSNLISDQMKSTIEMVKATTEAIKNLK